MARDKKVIPLNQEISELRFPPGDPRNDMTDEEIFAFAAREEAELNMKIGKFMQANPLPSNDVTEQEDEEVEDFSIDLSNGIVTQKVAEGIILKGDYDGDYIVNSTVPTLVAETPDLPYTRLITDIFVRKAIASLISKINVSHSDLEEKYYKLPVYGIGSGLYKEIEELYNKKNALRLSIQGNIVDYAKIPEWAQGYVQGYIEDCLAELIRFGEADK